MLLSEVKDKAFSLKQRRDLLKENLEEEKKKKLSLSRDIRNVTEAQLVVQDVARKTQEQLSDKISDIVTLALSSIFDDPYEFKIKYEEKRGKTEATLLFVKNENETDPINAAGGGVVDLASFALRIALWNITKPKLRNTIILDESFKYLSKDHSEQVGKLLNLLSSKLNIQFILTTHDSLLESYADKLFRVTNKKGVSYVEEVRKTPDSELPGSDTD